MTKLEFPVGNYKLHEDPNFNFQLNRTHKIGGDLDEIKAMAAQVTDIPSYVALMKQAVKKAKAEGRKKAAVAYLRAEDFFTPAKNNKVAVYDEYIKLYYEVNAPILEENNVQKALIPYEKGFLPVMYCVHDNPKGTIVLHGGFDSYVQEHLKFMIYMYQNGYSAYIFEGPGQGECINKYDMPFTPDWHKPVGALLDYFHLDDVALVGISMGSLLCKRAAAKEPRIKYLFAVGTLTDMAEISYLRMNATMREKLKAALASEDQDEVNALVETMRKNNLTYDWSVEHGMYVFGKDTPYDYLKAAAEYDIAPLAGRITQDYLLVAGANDHFTPLSFTHGEIDTMTSARSFTLRIIKAAEQGDDHCNVSNRKLMLDIFINWLENIKKLKAETEKAVADGHH